MTSFRASFSVLLASVSAWACGGSSSTPTVEERWRYEAESTVTPPGLGPEERVVIALTGARSDGGGAIVTVNERGPQAVEGPFNGQALAAPVAPVFVGPRVLFLTPIGRVVQIDLAGQELANLSLADGPSTPSGFTQQSTQLASAASTGQLVILEGVEAAVLRRIELGSVPTSAPIFGPNLSLYVATDDGQVRGFDAAGQVIFRANMSGLASGPSLRSDGVVVAGDGSGVSAFAANGAPVFQRPRPARVVGTVPLEAGQILAYGEDGAVERLDEMGTLVWRFQTKETNPPPVYLPPIPLAGDHTLVFDDSGAVHLLSPEGLRLAKLELGERPAGPALLGSTGLVFVSVGRTLRALGIVLPE
jgi:outer membrane protein assembly factor BamB